MAQRKINQIEYVKSACCVNKMTRYRFSTFNLIHH